MKHHALHVTCLDIVVLNLIKCYADINYYLTILILLLSLDGSDYETYFLEHSYLPLYPVLFYCPTVTLASTRNSFLRSCATNTSVEEIGDRYEVGIRCTAGWNPKQ